MVEGDDPKSPKLNRVKDRRLELDMNVSQDRSTARTAPNTTTTIDLAK